MNTASTQIHSGWGKIQGSVLKSFKKRWFSMILDQFDDGTHKSSIVYCKKEEGSEVGRVPIDRMSEFIVLESDESGCSFSIGPSDPMACRTSARTFYLQCEDKSEVELWQSKFQEALDFARSGAVIESEEELEDAAEIALTSGLAAPSKADDPETVSFVNPLL
eukprot:TRINITY_DN773284_c0_g1_i1.p1 TRINITY_DN773284_c0_g1~~TRINITY_DN773284_c0_g1_i1.p1  ORF type:complete len:181 (-),score=43.27 TRINITY_DN773284_c0_g1_i1:326-814(-)